LFIVKTSYIISNFGKLTNKFCNRYKLFLHVLWRFKLYWGWFYHWPVWIPAVLWQIIASRRVPAGYVQETSGCETLLGSHKKCSKSTARSMFITAV